MFEHVLQPVVFWGMGGFPGYVSSYHFLNASNRVWPASFAGKCPRRGAPVDAAGHGLWSEDDGYDGYDGDAEDAEDGEEMQVEEVRFLLMGRKKSQTANHRTWDGAKTLQILRIITLATSTGAIRFKDSWGMEQNPIHIPT